jgi:putative transposase
MAYVDLNPIRAGLTEHLEKSEFTSIKKRLETTNPQQLQLTIKAIAGEVKNRTLNLKLKDYINLVEWTGKTICHPGKHKIPHQLSTVFERLNLNQDNWIKQVNGYGNSYYRAVGCLEKLKLKAAQLEQQWLKGMKQIQQLYLSPH